MDRGTFLIACVCAFAVGWCLSDAMYVGAFVFGCILALVAFSAYDFVRPNEGGETE